jgi:hypothetical protein
VWWRLMPCPFVLAPTTAHDGRRSHHRVLGSSGFQVARWLSPLVRPVIRRTARKLGVDDLAYAERRYELRQHAELLADRQETCGVRQRRRP